MRCLYGLLVRLATPAVFAYFLWRARREPAYRHGWSQRLGRLPPECPRGAVWIHAASVGEVQAIVPVIEDLLAWQPECPVVVTTLTPAGRDRVAERLGERVHHCYLPLDLPGAVRRFLAQLRPRLGIIVEMELWPELLAAARSRGLAMHLVNARLSATTLRRYQRLHGLFREALSSFEHIAAQTDADRNRLMTLGAPPERVTVSGNIKFDQPLDHDQLEAGEQLRRQLGTDRPIWVAASTREGEEEQALTAFARVREDLPKAGLILVPRHPQRFDGIARLVAERGYRLQRRSNNQPPDAATDVYLGDSVGEMGHYLTAGDVVFVGGSLVPVGGHNLLEPAAIGRPVIVGPHRFNFTAVADLLESNAALVTVHDAAELAAAVTDLLTDEYRRHEMAMAAQRCVTANQGARQRLLERLKTAIQNQ